MEVRASAPAKVILFGEHFVVYNQPALVLAVDKRVQVSARLREDQHIHIRSSNLGLSAIFTEDHFQPQRRGKEAHRRLEPIRIATQKILDISGEKVGVEIEISSRIPVAAGLGSSAAVSAAVAASVSRLLNLQISKEKIFDITLEAERFIHRTPSGIDPAISTYGGLILFQKDRGVTPLEIDVDLPLVVGDTQLKRSTGDMVAEVGKRREQCPSVIDPVLKAGAEIVQSAIQALKNGDLPELGELMDINQGLLSAVGVSNESLERIIYAARNAGALGAKLTGAGGGGCMIALCPEERLEDVAQAIREVGGTAFLARKTDDGVRVEAT
ncbi:MAG: mevalonate kinase [Desulfobacterales bacterium]|nr:mevalonate kinase [Desulfobacterales bacterium]